MKSDQVREVIDCLPKGRTHFRYFKEGYAPKILSMALPGESSVQSIRKSTFGKFLQTGVLKDTLAKCGNGRIDPAMLKATWREPSRPYLLTLSTWRYQSRQWSQVSRAGDNLVLQLNLPRIHNQLYESQVGNGVRFNPSWDHPVQTARNQREFRDTLAWARMDLSFETGEVLIEEVQSDAVRRMAHLARRATACGCDRCKARQKYLSWFSAYQSQWSEAMLTAAIEFVFNELGIRQIFMHTARSGWRVKKMDRHWRPPKSLYSTLPSKLSFRRVWNAPAFLLETRSYHKLVREQPDIDFYLLDLTWPDSGSRGSNVAGDQHA